MEQAEAHGATPSVGKRTQLYSTATTAIEAFYSYLNQLLRDTITPIELDSIATATGAVFQFPDGRCVPLNPVGRGFHFFVGQTIDAVRVHGKQGSDRQKLLGYRVRTLAYEYRLTESPAMKPYIIRWEYNSREQKPGTYPRHHVQMPIYFTCFDGTAREFRIDLEELHLSTGYVTLEEVIRFLVNELGLRPRKTHWDNILTKSERRFRGWTFRNV